MAEIHALLARLPGFGAPQGQPDGALASVVPFAALLVDPAATVVAEPTPATKAAPEPRGATLLIPVRQLASGHLSYVACEGAATTPIVTTAAPGNTTAATMPEVMHGLMAVDRADAGDASPPEDATFTPVVRSLDPAPATSSAAPAKLFAARATAALGVMFPLRSLHVVADDGEVTVLLRDFTLDQRARAALVTAVLRAIPDRSLNRIVCNGELVWSQEVQCP